MKKVMVIGCCGAGKTTFSMKLSQLLQIEVIHLDKEYWKPSWSRPLNSKWESTVKELCKTPSWIMDGNYNSTLETRAQVADTIIFLDYSSIICLKRVLTRLIRNDRNRNDLPKGCDERFDLTFLKYVWTFRKKMRPQIIEKLNELNSKPKVIYLKNDREAAVFLEGRI